MSDPASVLLDTCAAIWLANGDPLAAEALTRISRAGLEQGIFVSPITAWEIGLLARPRSDRASPVRFLPDPKTWFARLIANPSLRLTPFTPEIAIDASHLPGMIHGDPADRLIIATARHRNLPLVTRDAKILAYAEAGHLSAIRC